MWRNPAALLALTVMILSLAGPARGSDYDSPESTGTPGNLSGYVDIQYCPQGRLLVGVGITTSTGMNLVDGITTACVAVSRTAASKPQWNGAPQGPTSSSTNGNLLCPTNSFVTQVVALQAFYPAEGYHQDYAEHHPNEPYIAINDLPKLDHLKQTLPELYVGK